MDRSCDKQSRLRPHSALLAAFVPVVQATADHLRLLHLRLVKINRGKS